MPQYVLGEIRMLTVKSLKEQKMFTHPPQIFLLLNAAPSACQACVVREVRLEMLWFIVKPLRIAQNGDSSATKGHCDQ